jgi:hypothetical protein
MFRGFEALERYLYLCLNAVIVIAKQMGTEAVSVL